MDKKIMNEESIPKILLKFGIPAIVGFLITAIYNFADAVFVGGLGTSALGALAVAFPISMISIGIGLILGSGAASSVSRLFAAPIVSIFTNESKVVEIGVQALIAYSIVFLAFGFQTIYMRLFIALGKGKGGRILSLGRQGIFLIPVILVLPKLVGLNGVIYAQPIADMLTALITIMFYFKFKKQLLKMESKAA